MKKKLLFIPIALMLVFSTVACTSKTTVTEKVKSEEVKVKDEAVKVENKVDKNLINYKDIKLMTFLKKNTLICSLKEWNWIEKVKSAHFYTE